MSPVRLRFRTFIAVVGVAAFMGACDAGTEDSDSPPPGTADSVGAAGPSPSASASDRQGTSGQDFPIPAPEGGVIITDEWNGTTGHITLRYPAHRHDEIVAFFDEYASGSGWNRSEVGEGDVLSVNQMNLVRGLNIAVDPPTGEHLIVTLTVS